MPTGDGHERQAERIVARSRRPSAAQALHHWWGVSVGVVWRWRKALRVGRTDSEGSRRLIRAAAEAGADVLRGVPLPAEECARRSRTNRELDLKRHLHPGYHGPRWTVEELALLGTLPDDEVAARIGKTPSAVRQKSEQLGIVNPAVNRWPPTVTPAADTPRVQNAGSVNVVGQQVNVAAGGSGPERGVLGAS
jgi:hypothetical protein